MMSSTRDKSALSRLWKGVRERFKKGVARLLRMLLRSKSYALFGIPSGLTSLPEAKNKILRISEGISTATGGHLNAQGRLITTYLLVNDGKPFHHHELFNLSARRFSPKICHTKESVVTLTLGWQGAFYHWFYEVLPRLQIIESAQIPIERLYIASKEPFQRDSLSMLGFSSEELISAQDWDAVQASEILIPALPDFEERVSFLRHRFLGQVPKKETGKRLYISRADATRRRVLNEEVVMQFLEKEGFEKITLAHRPLIEQMALFRSADIIVAPHGAALSLLPLCEPKTRLLELFAPSYLNPCYERISRVLGISYTSLLGKEYKKEIDPDFSINVAELKDALTHR